MCRLYGIALIITYFCNIKNISAFLEDEPQCFSRFDYEYKVVQKLNELENKIKEHEQSIETISSKDEGQTESKYIVAFSAFLTADMISVPDHQTIIFNEVQTNVGQAYNGRTGIFACRTPGVYVFYWVVTNNDHTCMDSNLVVNGEERSRAFSDAGNHADYSVQCSCNGIKVRGSGLDKKWYLAQWKTRRSSQNILLWLEAVDSLIQIPGKELN